MPVRTPRVAVLLAAYNGMQWIEEQIASILGQVAVQVSIYISVDASTDGTESWCEEFAARHANVNLLPCGERFGGASRNFFRLLRDVDLRDYDYISFADQDDIWHDDKLERAIASLRDTGADACSSNVTAFWENGSRRLIHKAQPQTRWDFLFEAAGPGCTYVLSATLAHAMKQSMLTHWQELQDVTLHDWYCYAFARSHGFRWYIDPRPSMEYRQHENNQVGANTGLGTMIARYKSVHDGWWFTQVALIARLTDRTTDPFVSSWLQLRRWQLIRLSFASWHCRRRIRDRILFFLICWGTALAGKAVG
ncbi:glycosyltransferase [Pseudomonas granadensis]|uniref:glycosyltransferase n=1 Tax=Pseudomonas granadensis TaxID=1421430 RepID=UPI00087D67B0|nr:glycosyltransferase [Pseudomonas granadensis]SDT37299.1 rhamnosyltransferase [Pseudomonas granadensis]